MKQLLSTLLLCITCIAMPAQEVKGEAAASASADTYTYVYTPGGQAVQVFTSSELSESEITQIETDCKRLFPNVTILSPASATYNCHNYAWHMLEGNYGEKYWMNSTTKNKSDNLSKYWTDDWHVETTGDDYDKIVYYKSDTFVDSLITHSAVPSASHEGYYESKWGMWPLVRHLPDDVPEGYGTYRRYFKPVPLSEPTHISVTGSINCSNGQGEIGVNVAANYYVSSSEIPFTAKYMRYEILNAKGDDAVDLGTAIVNSHDYRQLNVTFTKQGLYEMYIYYYNKYFEMISNFWFEPAVINR